MNINKVNELLNLYKTDFSYINLTRILEFDDFYKKQILDSVNPYYESQTFKNNLDRTGLMIDLGFGGGFPILPMAIECPQYKFIGIDSIRKKVEAVAAISSCLKLSNTKFYNSRFEKIYFDQPCVITLKAVGNLIEILNMIYLEKSSVIYFYKSTKYFLEEKPKINLEVWDIIEELEINLEGIDKRIFIGLKQKVPRRTPNNLVKYSSLEL